MDDLQKEFIAASQDEERLQTFVIHVPVLGAREVNVPGAMKLLDGPRVTHYWNESGDLGRDFSQVLEMGRMTAWDVWMIYPPDVAWEETLAPAPDHWQQQHGSDPEHRFDPATFAALTRGLLSESSL